MPLSWTCDKCGAVSTCKQEIYGIFPLKANGLPHEYSEIYCGNCINEIKNAPEQIKELENRIYQWSTSYEKLKQKYRILRTAKLKELQLCLTGKKVIK